MLLLYAYRFIFVQFGMNFYAIINYILFLNSYHANQCFNAHKQITFLNEM